MIYLKRLPSSQLEQLIECYWLIDSEGYREISEEKIIPDGFPETIWHYGDAYEIKIKNEWQPQTKALLAGQLTNHFFLRNTGSSGMIGIKWKPHALHQLFKIDMTNLVDQVVELPDSLQSLFIHLNSTELEKVDESTLINLDSHLLATLDLSTEYNITAKAIEFIHLSHGQSDIESISSQLNISSRSLERHFKKAIGLSPKFYSRIIRLKHVFEMVESGNRDWADIVFQSGYYDQAHFIKNFKEFIGEDPTSYGFDQQNMANFHLKK